MSELDAVVVGGGLSGLACALDLTSAGRSVLLLEASDGVGGRVRTDEVDGFLLDRGFQVLLEAYPECRRRLDLDALELRPFYPGALVRAEGAFHRLADPTQEMADALRSVCTPVGSVADKVKVALLRKRLADRPAESLLSDPAGSTREELDALGFSSQMVERFFRPFLGGVLLDPTLQVSARLFRFYFRTFAQGRTSVPARGMEALPRQLADRLPHGTIRTRTRVASVAPGEVRTVDGEVIQAPSVVVAVEGPEAARLLGERLPDPGSRPVLCLYFDAPEAPLKEGVLVLNGEGSGPVNHLAVLSEVAPGYAPPGRALVSVTLLPGGPHWPGVNGGREPDTEALEMATRAQLTEWFGRGVENWRLLRSYHIRHGQPLQTPDRMDPPSRPVRLAPGLFVAGDHRENASLNGALVAGARAAREVLREA
jgi:phytoene dehydrogenase-like protein